MDPRRRAPGQPAARPRSGLRNNRVLALLCVILAATAALVTSEDVQGAGAATPSYSPYGHVDHQVRRTGGMRLIGWTIDPSSVKRALTVDALVDGKRTASAVANRSRPDVGRKYPSAGSLHGFDFVTPVPEGRHTVCVRARNLYHGANVQLRCRTAVFDYGPAGQVQSVTATRGAFVVKGWAVDGDALYTPVSVRVSIDGKVTTVSASRDDPAIATLRPGAGTAHGFLVTLPAGQGQHRICAVATNIGIGTDNSYGCRTVTLDERPSGHIDVLGQRSGRLEIRGWTFDKDSPATPLTLVLTIDGKQSTVRANGSRPDVGKKYPAAGSAHGFDVIRVLPEGAHTVQVVARNLDLGRDRVLADRSATLNFTPSAALVSLTATAGSPIVRAQGWAVDPDTSLPIKVQLTVNGKARSTVTANHKGPRGAKYPGRNFGADLTLLSGTWKVCAIGINTLYGSKNSPTSCRSVSIALSPKGHYDTATRVSNANGIQVTGWAFDPDTAKAINVAVTVDGVAFPNLSATATRADVAKAYPGSGTDHGFASVLATTDGEHRICLTARNVSGGKDLSLGCKIVIAVHPVAPDAPRSVKAAGSYQAANVSWTAPASDGGAPETKYVVTAAPGGRSVTVARTATKATVTGLKQKYPYVFTVRAVNVAGTSAAGTSARVTTLAGPAPQRTPAPVATSRYIRNIRGSSASELARMRAEGVADARSNPSNHRYLVLLDIGGQDQGDGGVVLSATTRFVSYANLVRDLNAYVAGYHSAQRGTAPATIALGTNNDMDVSASAGAAWAKSVVNRVKSYPGLAIAGANDIEPGFRASYTQTRSWLSGYLGGTSRPFVFNGSADGCAWTVTNRGCNNGWSMARLYTLAAGAAPTRMLSLPQIYNTTMAAQWKYISLTGVTKGQKRINFGGPLTELTACRQVRNCGSLSGRTAWSTLWRDLQSDSRLKVSSLPYATDLRIDS